MADGVDEYGREPIEGVLFDLLMAVMDSPAVWAAAARDTRRGMEWRDAVTSRMAPSSRYAPYEDLVAEVGEQLGLPARATSDLFRAWRLMPPRPDASAIARLPVPYAFVTNCSRELADIAARRSGTRPRFVLSAEEAGCYKPHPRIYQTACRKLETAPERTLFVAGAVYDAEGARNAGLPSALVARRTDQPRPARRIPVLESLSEVLAIVTESQAFRHPAK